MRLLLLHNEDEFFGGAESLLIHFVDKLAVQGREVALALVKGSRLDQRLPGTLDRVYISSSRAFSLRKLRQQAKVLTDYRRHFRYDLIHGWAARTWELGGLLRHRTGCPALLTLHDHPRAHYLSFARSRLMWASACFAADGVACVSDAVRKACLECHYPAGKLEVVHNGFPKEWLSSSVPKRNKPIRIGFVGHWSPPKGLDGLFKILDKLAELITPGGWECRIAGSPLPHYRDWLRETCDQFSDRAWWSRVEWVGWVDDPQSFLRSLDLLIFPSREFDSFPNVLLEAGFAGIPVMAASVGGAPEIVRDGETGWLFPRDDWDYAASRLADAIQDPDHLSSLGHNAQRRMGEAFTSEDMVAGYFDLYRRLAVDRGQVA